jgi:hypothetical protein
VLEVFKTTPSQSENVELNIEVLPDDNWRSRRGTSHNTRNVDYSNEFDLTKEN